MLLMNIDPFPEGFGATVFFSWPGKDFQLLGGLSNTKPSAIFKLAGNQQALGMNNVVANLGISVEPLQAVEAQMNTLPKNQNSQKAALTVAPPSAATLTTKIVSNL